MLIAYKEYLKLRQYFLIVINSFSVPIEDRIRYIIILEDLDKSIRNKRITKSKRRLSKMKSVGIKIRPFRQTDLNWS